LSYIQSHGKYRKEALNYIRHVDIWDI